MSTSLGTTSGEPLPLSAVLAPLGVWLLMAVVAVANGAFRETVLVPRIGDYPGHVLSTLLLVSAILAVAYAFFATTSVDYSSTQLLLVGATWTVMTTGFEFLVGYVEGTPVSVTLGQYDVLAGQVWILVPLTLLVAPYLFGRVLKG